MQARAILNYLGTPLRVESLLLIALFSIGMTSAEQMGVFGIVVVLTLGSWFFKYAFMLLDHVADGHRGAPVLSAEMANPMQQRPLGLLLLLIFFYSITAWAQPLIGVAGVTALRAALLALVPAMIATMAATGEFAQALNPKAVFGMIARIPLAYATMLATIALLWFIPITILLGATGSLATLWQAQTFLPYGLTNAIGGQGILIGWLGHMLFMYLWLAMFAGVGGMIYEHREDLDFEPAESPERSAARATAQIEREHDKEMDRVFAELRGGAFKNAAKTVRQMIEHSPQPLDEARWLYRRAAATHEGLASYLAQLLIPLLLTAHAHGEVLRLVKERLARDEEFRPAKASETIRLAALARDGGDRPTARTLLADFERHFPNDALTDTVQTLRHELAR